MKKIMTIVGARPQFVKAAIVSRALQKKTQLREILVHTGQHFDNNMSAVFFEELELPPIVHQLQVNSTKHGQQTAEMLTAIEAVLLEEKPDVVLIYGDTNSTLAGGLAAAKLHIPLAHVEAGLRSYNRKMPEEINRVVVDHLSELLFTPTKTATANLLREGLSAAKIMEVGDVMYDAALYYGEKAARNSSILNQLQSQPKQYILATIHRAENTDDPHRLFIIFSALEKIAKNIKLLMPLHPRTKKALAQYHPHLLANANLVILEPLGFLDMIMLEKHAKLIITDSGGVQKEAFFYQVPCVTLRGETEWLETVELQWNRIVEPTQAALIYDQVLQALETVGLREHYPYGQGEAAEQIAQYFA